MPTLYDAMRAAGFEPPSNINAGQTVRFSTNGKSSDKAGWVHIFPDSKGAAFGCNRSGEQHVWQEARDKPFNEAEQAKFKQDCIEANKARNREKEADYQQVALTTQAEWEASALAPELHPYLVKKGIKPNMARVDVHGNLLIPIYGLVGQIQSLQRIAPDGQKRFVKGGKMRSGHAWIGTPEDGATLLLAEGFGTSDTLHRATGYAVCICFSAGNLCNVAQMMRKRYPKARLIITGDDDTKTEGNPGRTKATEAAQAVAGTAVFPVFSTQHGGDFNDLEQIDGLDAVSNHFELMQLPTVQVVFDTPVLSGTDSRDGTDSTRPLSELGNAMRLMDAHGGNVYYVHDAKAWMQWNCGSWNWDINGAAVRGLAARLPQQIYNEGGLHLADALYFAKWSRTSQQEKTVLAAVSLLKDFDRVRLSLSSVDADLFKVGFDNARQILDLRTGTARPARQGDLITKSLSVDRLGVASKAIRWQQFLTQIFGDDIELIDWLKRWCGYMLTGSTAEQIFIFCFGLGANGKSVLGDILRYILCDYARAIASETLTESKRAAGSATPDLAELVGARMAVCAETEDGAALAESLVKSLVSGDTMTARGLHRDPFQLTPQFKLMMLGNHKPIIKGNDHGMWRRVRLIPFKRTFKPEERDAELSDKLKAEAPHILAWMLEGCIDWQKRGLKDTPKTIEQATGTYQVEQDLIGSWLSECCDLSPMNEASSTDIYANYKNWCLDNGLRPNSSIALGRRLSERGFHPIKIRGVRSWAGLTVINSSYSGATGQQVVDKIGQMDR